MARANPEDRLRDYQTAINWWDAQDGPHSPDSILVCENSGISIAPAAPHPAGEGSASAPSWRRAHVMTWDGQGFDRSLGKGFGEMCTIRTAFEQMDTSWLSNDWVIKCNGRYRVPAAHRFFAHLRESRDVDMIADMTRQLTWCDSRFFGARVDCWKRYILPRCQQINESTSYYFEHSLARAAHALMADGGTFRLLPFAPVIQGVSGSLGYDYKSPRAFLRQALKRMLYPLKRAAFKV